MRSLLRGFVLLLVFAGGWWLAARLRSPGQPGVDAEAGDGASFVRGQAIYQSLCQHCHAADGRGTPRPDAPAQLMAPSLADSTRVAGHPDYLVNVLLYGLSGPIDGQEYQEVMIPLSANPDEWIADVATYVRKQFAQADAPVRPADVGRVRAVMGKRGHWTVPELMAHLPRTEPKSGPARER
jgi:mono/diheme cytochrome c family protein